MIEFTETIQINRHISDVFAFISNIERLLERNFSIDRIEVVDDAYHLYRNQGVQTFETIRVLHFNPDHHISLIAQGERFSYKMTYDLTEIDEQTTELVNHAEIEPDSNKDVMFKIMQSKVKDEVGQDLVSLKKVLERKHQ